MKNKINMKTYISANEEIYQKLFRNINSKLDAINKKLESIQQKFELVPHNSDSVQTKGITKK